MEAVPRLPMLSFELRSSVEKVDFSIKLKQYIKNHYNEDPTLYASAITSIDSMRKEAVNPSKSIEGCSIMKRYYCQLHLMTNRFPMCENEEASIPFSWKALHSNSTITLSDISLEMASILYNIGALHTQLGAMDCRTSAEGMKMSCTHFQCAAWAFQHINEEYPFPNGYGLSPVLMSFMCHLCLAQAQECILEKSMMDNRKSAITAKVGVQVVDYYKQSLSLLSEWPESEDIPSDITCSKIYKNWHKYLLFKIAYYESISLLFQGQQSEDQQKMGERVSFYQAAFNKLEEATKLPPGIDNTKNITEALTFVRDVIEAKRKAAKNENEFIYHEEVPSLVDLPKIKGASLVKGISFDVNDPEVCGPDLFSNIVPMRAHESASLYSEEKAKLLRKVNGNIENKNEELETFLSMLDLEEIKTKSCGNKLPQDLIDRCASLSAKPDAIQNLTDAMCKLSDIYQEVGSNLTEIKELLTEEENREKEYQQVFGKRPPSIAATDLTREAKKYYEAHAKASESNQTLHKAMVMHVSNLKLLSLPLKELMNHIPTISESPEVESILRDMQHLVSKVEEMKQQRLMLAGQLRDLVCNDDITRQVLTYSGDDIQVLFERELKKYDKYVSLVEQNLAAQENILRALKETYARYGSTRKNTGELHRKRGAIISSLIASYDAYEDLLSKSSKGLDFYKKLETNVSKLLQRVKGTCKVQDEEREQMLKTVKKSDVGPAQSDAASSNTLKLKDYLNIKKETGKLSLEPTSTVPNSTPYFNDTTLPQQNWIPSVRPAPVGSEETDTSFNVPLDSFRGFYQSQGKDQIWSNSHYSAPQSADQKLKFFLPHANSSYSNNSQNSSFPLQEDAYPISSYSTLAPKVEGQGGYEPKSNYYDVHGSPNRCYNLPNSYNNSVGSTSTSSYKIPKVGLNQVSESNDFGQNASDISSYNDYANQITSTYTASQQLHGNFSPLPEALSFGSSQSFENQSRMLTTYNPSTFSQPHLSFTSTETDQNLYSSGTCPPPQIQTSTLYNSFSTIQTPTVYGTSNDNQPTQCLDASAYSSMYQAPLATSIPSESTTNFTPQKQIKDFPNSQSYQIPVTTFAPDTQMTYHNSHIPQSSCPYGSASTNSYVDYSSVEGIPTQYPRGTDGTLAPWLDPNLHLSDQQYLQSGNESLYTASQIPNQYAMTNSDVYKTSEPQNLNYQNYHGQYYSNQYGAYSSPADFNAHSGNVTYMQAGTDKQQAITTTTFSNSETKSSPVTNPSNVDLLAGLDFNISHSPLVPEVTASLKKEDQNEDKSNALKVLSKPPPETTLKLDLDKECVKEESSSLKDCMSNKENIAHFAQEVEKYEKFVEGLTLKTLNGPTSLDLKWKEIVDAQEKISPHHIISVARCYPMKNRFPDILPYDDSRVELPSTKDDYINASRMTGLTELTPPFILTQAPLPSTYADFWAMIYEQQVEVIVCLLGDSELGGCVYWPLEKGQELEMGKLKVSLQSSNIRSHWVERILSICVMETKVTRVVVHLQFTTWPGSSFPESPGPFLSFALECNNFFAQQRSSSHPVAVHCISGVGRTGLFCLIIASVLDIQAGKGIPDLATLTGRMCQFRKSCLRDREHLKFAYQAVLYYCQDFLIKRGVITSRSTFEAKKPKPGKCSTRHPSEDFLGAPVLDNQLQLEMERLQIDSYPKKESENKNISKGGQSQSVCSSISCTSSGRSSPSSLPSDVVLPLESATVSSKVDSSNHKKKKFTVDNFNKGSSIESFVPSNDDPLSQLDPLWTIKK